MTIGLSDSQIAAARLPRCAECPIQPDGYPPALERKFAFPDGLDQEESQSYTTVYQCPKCKDIVVD